MSEIMPDMPSHCWPVDHSACTTWSQYAPAVQAAADAMAGQTLRALTGYLVGGCPVTVRPCPPRSSTVYLRGFDALYFTPLIYGGSWYNSVCPKVGCGCQAGLRVHLPGPIGRVDEILIDGVEIPPPDWRVDGATILRTDGLTWPMSQDLTLPTDYPNTFAITYLNAAQVDGLGAYVAGLLACEMAAGLTGGECRLPTGTTSVQRAGLSFTVASGAFPDGLTGIAEVDQYIRYWNPHRLVQQSSVWSPDMPQVYL